jgi:DNA-binding NarL/FixJ family response regulator
MIKVMVVDDNDLVRDGLVGLLEGMPDVSVVAECCDGEDVLEVAREAHPDVVLMDIAMARIDGLEATRRLLSEEPGAKIVILTGSLTVKHVRRAHELGAVGFLLKDGDPSELPDAIRTVAAGGTAWGRAAAVYLPAT